MSALVIKLIASLCMLLDHIGYRGAPAVPALRAAGRIAFPLYVFLMTEGFRHTSDRLRYGLRLLLFAILSQAPFWLLMAEDTWYGYWNVMVTLLLALLCLWLLEICGKRKLLFFAAIPGILGLCAILDLGILHTDYGAKGILLAVSFYYLFPQPGAPAGKRFLPTWLSWILLTLAFFVSVFHVYLYHLGLDVLRWMLGKGLRLTPLKRWSRMQLYALLALPLIFLYNGRRGWAPKSRPGRKCLQYAFYLFYPAHMLVLYWLFRA